MIDSIDDHWCPNENKTSERRVSSVWFGTLLGAWIYSDLQRRAERVKTTKTACNMRPEPLKATFVAISQTGTNTWRKCCGQPSMFTTDPGMMDSAGVWNLTLIYEGWACSTSDLINLDLTYRLLPLDKIVWASCSASEYRITQHQEHIYYFLRSYICSSFLHVNNNKWY
jgi:hypothetical protein